MAHNLDKSVISILNPEGSVVGTGFVVGPALAVTCAHVVLAAKAQAGGLLSARYYLDPQKAAIQAYVIPESWSAVEEDDTAFLRLLSSISGIEPVLLGGAEQSSGHRYASLGFPKSTLVEARRPLDLINGLVRRPNGGEYLELKGEEVYFGLSGAPVLDLDIDLVVGMITSGQDDRFTRFAYAVPAHVLVRRCPEIQMTSIAQGASASDKSAGGTSTLSIDPIRLRKGMIKTCNKACLKAHCFELEINDEDIPGDTISEKVLSLIQHCQRRNLYTRLCEEILAEHPYLVVE